MVRDSAMKDINSFLGAEKLEIAFSRGYFHWDEIVAAVVFLIALAVLLFDSSLFINDPFEHVLFECPQGEKPTQKPTQSNIGKVLEEQAKDFVIFYGSQSGRAYELAQRLSRDISRSFSKAALVADLSDYDCASVVDIPRQKLVIFILSTYGEGDPPDNASRLAEWIQGLPKKPILQNLHFTMLGLGNSNYKFYNRFALQTSEKLQVLGATPIMALELVDDAEGNTQDSFVMWKKKLFETFVQNLGITECPRPYEPLISITPSDSDGDQTQMYRPVGPHQASKTADSVVYPAIVSHIQNITPNAPRETLHVDIDISNEPKLKYAVGDHIAIWPENSTSEMQELLEALGLSEADMHRPKVIDRIDPDTPVPWPRPVTLHALFERHLDIAALVSRDLILDLKQFAKTPSSQEALDGLARNYKNLCLTQRTTLASLLRLANPEASAWADIPHSFLLENLTPIKPRYYSISSSPAVSPRTISFTVAVKDIDLASGERLLGLMSNTLLRMHQAHDGPCPRGPRLWCNVRKSKFKPPVSPMQPIVMVANGSGISPFIGFLRHRLRTFQLKGDVGKMLLIYGCQNEQMHLYKSEIEKIQDVLGDRLQVVLAYSRKGGGYVQDQIRAHGLDVAELICSEKANMYICGSTVMAREVRTRLLELVQGRGSSKQQSQEFEAAQMRTKRWQFDAWG